MQYNNPVLEQQKQSQHGFLSSPPPSQQQQQPWGEQQSRILDSQVFPKSHSIENISREYQGMWGRQNQQQTSHEQQQQQNDCDSVNLHRKLQRQLTLNPAGCDPRIYQMQRVSLMNQQQHQQQQQSQHSPHRPLAPSSSGPHHPVQWDLHQVCFFFLLI